MKLDVYSLILHPTKLLSSPVECERIHKDEMSPIWIHMSVNMHSYVREHVFPRRILLLVHCFETNVLGLLVGMSPKGMVVARGGALPLQW